MQREGEIRFFCAKIGKKIIEDAWLDSKCKQCACASNAGIELDWLCWSCVSIHGHRAY